MLFALQRYKKILIYTNRVPENLNFLLHYAYAYVFLIYARTLYRQISLKSSNYQSPITNYQFLQKITPTDYQAVTKKVHFFLHFFSKIFGHIKKKLYLCTRF